VALRFLYSLSESIHFTHPNVDAVCRCFKTKSSEHAQIFLRSMFCVPSKESESDFFIRFRKSKRTTFYIALLCSESSLVPVEMVQFLLKL